MKEKAAILKINFHFQTVGNLRPKPSTPRSPEDLRYRVILSLLAVQTFNRVQYFENLQYPVYRASNEEKITRIFTINDRKHLLALSHLRHYLIKTLCTMLNGCQPKVSKCEIGTSMMALI